MENLDIKALEVIEKSRGAQIGEVRTWGGKEYIKTPKGWRPKPKGYKEGEKKQEVTETASSRKKEIEVESKLKELAKLKEERTSFETEMERAFDENDKNKYNEALSNYKAHGTKINNLMEAISKYMNENYRSSMRGNEGGVTVESKKEHGSKDKGNLPSDANKFEGGEKEGDLIVEFKDDEKAKEYERRISSLKNELSVAIKRNDYTASNRLSKELVGLKREYKKIMNAK